MLLQAASEAPTESAHLKNLRWYSFRADIRGRLVAQPGNKSTWLTVGESGTFLRIFWPAH